jgi:hypothetical protein
VFAGAPTTPEPNTLYMLGRDGSGQAADFFIVYRVYLPDRGTALRGGVDLPAVTYETPAGAWTLPSCSYPDPGSKGLNDAIAASSGPGAMPGPGLDPPVWHRFLNLATSFAQGSDNTATGSQGSDRAKPYTAKLGYGGFLEDRENAYLYAVLNASFGNVLVIHAQAPTFPDTFSGQRRMGTGQVRYWDVCSYESYTERNYACVADYQAPETRSRSYTIVVSTPANRPANAGTHCGVAWLPWGPTSQSLLILRHQLAHPAFAYSVQKARYDHEQADMGAYYPSARYTTRARFEERGCDRAAA